MNPNNPPLRTQEEQRLRDELARLKRALKTCAKGPQLVSIKGEYKTLHPEEIAKKALKNQ